MPRPHVPDRSYQRFQPDGFTPAPRWDPYPQYVRDDELASLSPDGPYRINHLYGGTTTLTADTPTITTGIAPDAAFNEGYVTSLNVAPANWPMELWGENSIAGNAHLVTISNGATGTVATKRVMTDADEITFLTNGTPWIYDIWVNHRPYASNPLAVVNSAATPGYSFTKLVFPSAYTPRLIEIRGLGGATAVYVKKPYRAWVPAPGLEPKIAVVGDSYVAPAVMLNSGAGSLGGDFYSWGLWQRAVAELGTPYILTDGIGGSGYISPSAQNMPYTHPDRIQWMIDLEPDVVVGHGGFANDFYNSYSVAASVAAAENWMRSIRSGLPNARIVFIEGFSPPTHPFNTNYPIARAALQEAVQDMSNVYFVDVATTRPPISGTGYVTAANGSGNSDIYIGSDQAHYTVRGASYLRGFIARKMLKVMADDGRLSGQLIT